ncbi:MAG: aminotransferase class IV [Rhodospirillaceae bacterium]|nr:aminotransferase class IV [Rhodospirillaceae bacterium]
MKIALNGKIVEVADARIDPADRGLAFGDGLFETMSLRKGRVRRLPAHLARLRLGAGALGIPLAYDDANLESQVTGLVAANTLTEAVVKITLTRGPDARGLALPARPKPTLLITTAEAPPEPEPARVIISSVTRRNEFSALSRFKTLNYLDNVIARDQAVQAGADDALLLNTQGRLAGGTAANVFLLVNGGLITPPVEEGALPGVARADAIRLTRAEEKPVTVETLIDASEVFLTNALGVRAVVRIGDKPVGDGEPGLITQLVATRV